MIFQMHPKLRTDQIFIVPLLVLPPQTTSIVPLLRDVTHTLMRAKTWRWHYHALTAALVLFFVVSSPFVVPPVPCWEGAEDIYHLTLMDFWSVCSLYVFWLFTKAIFMPEAKEWQSPPPTQCKGVVAPDLYTSPTTWGGILGILFLIPAIER